MSQLLKWMREDPEAVCMVLLASAVLVIAVGLVAALLIGMLA